MSVLRALASFSLFACFLLASYAKNRTFGCLRLLHEQPDIFKPCINHICLLFKESHPLVELGAMPHPPEEKPFRCRKRNKLYMNLKGLFFDFIDMFDELEDAYCIHLGDNCDHDDVTQILQDSSTSSDFQWIAGGGLFLVPYRIGSNSVPSAPFYSGRTQVFAKRTTSLEAANKQIEALVSAFAPSTWIFLTTIYLLSFKLRALLIYALGAPINITHFGWAMLGEPYKSHSKVRKKNRRTLNSCLAWWWSVNLVVTSIAVLLYEIAVVGFIFDGNLFLLDVRITNLTRRQLSKFAVVANSAEEYYLSLLSTGLHRSIRNSNTTTPWVVRKTSAEVFEVISKGTARYGVTHEHYGKYLLRKQGACSRFVLYNTEDISQEYFAVWYLSKNLSSSPKGLAINQRISALRDSQRLSEKIRAVVPNEDDPCGEQPKSIQLPLLAIPVGSVFFPFFVIVLGRIVRFEFVRSRAKTHSFDDQNNTWSFS